MEGNDLFIATSSIISYGQTRGTCIDVNRHCTTATDCVVALEETCNQGFCQVSAQKKLLDC